MWRYSQTLHVWHICLHWGGFRGQWGGKYASPMGRVWDWLQQVGSPLTSNYFRYISGSQEAYWSYNPPKYRQQKQLVDGWG